jgi:uncharacterized protein
MLLLLALLASSLLPSAPTRYVTDAANVIPDDREHALNEKLAQYDRKTSHQVIVYVDRKVPEGTTLEEMGAEAIKTWGAGRQEKDNIAILFLFIDGGKSRIEAGQRLEGVLTDLRSTQVLAGMGGALRADDYAGAVETGTNGIIHTIESPGMPPYHEIAQPEDAIGDSMELLGMTLVPCLVVVFAVLGVLALILFLLVKFKVFPSAGSSGGNSSSSSS